MSDEKDKSACKKKDVKDFECLLKKKFGDKFKVLEYTVSDLCSFGENFAGGLLKIDAKVQYAENSPVEELHLVGKQIISSEVGMNWTTFLTKETFMYNAIVPFYARVELESRTKDKATMKHLLPEMYGFRFSLDPEKKVADEDCVLLLENLKTQGYYTQGKITGLDLEHAQLAIKTLSKFHAFGIATRIKYPDVFKKFRAMADRTGYEYGEEQFVMMVDNFKKYLRTMPEFTKYIPKIENAIDQRSHLGAQLDLIRSEDWSTIAHFDYWTNNLLFHKNESGQLDDLKIIDFQGYTYADIFVDLYYCMCSSLMDDVKLNHFDELLDLYYDTFTDTLKSTGIDLKPYIRKKFDARMKEIAKYQLFHCVFALTFFTCEPENEDREAFFSKIFAFQNGANFNKKIGQLIQIFERKDWF